MTLAVVAPPFALFVQCPVGQHQSKQLVVRVDEAVIAAREGDMNVLRDILLVETQPAFQLNLQKGLAVNMARDEIRALPIIGQAQLNP